MLDALVRSISSRDLLRYIYQLTCENHLQELIRLGNRLFVLYWDTQRKLEGMTSAFDTQLRHHLQSILEGDLDLATLELYVVFRHLQGHLTDAYQDLSREQREVTRLYQQRYVNAFTTETCHRSWLVVYLRNRTRAGRALLTRRDVLQSIQLIGREIGLSRQSCAIVPRMHHIKWRMYQYMVGWVSGYFTSWRFWIMRRFCLFPPALLPLADRLVRHADAIRAFLHADLNPNAALE